MEERVSLNADAPALAAVHDALRRFWERTTGVLPAPDQQTWRLEFATAVLEIASNIVRHAHPPGQRAAAFSLRLRLFQDGAEAVLTDSGGALTAALPDRGLPDPLEPDWTSLPEAGMGLAVARAAVDELDYQRRGDSNVWRLTKRFPST